MVLLTGRPYAIGWALDGDGDGVAGADHGAGGSLRPAAVVQAFFPGEEGGTAIADLLTGAASPSGRLPVSLPRAAGAQPYTYLHPRLGGPSDVTAADSTPVRPFGFGLGYTSFAYDDLVVDASVRSDAGFEASVTVRNTGSRDGEDVVQLYGHDVHGSVTRPEVQLLGYARVALAAGSPRGSASGCPSSGSRSPTGGCARSWNPGTCRSGSRPTRRRHDREARCRQAGSSRPVVGRPDNPSPAPRRSARRSR